MAFSQVQCLDDSHVNWRSSESKPEFFYSEEQRLALEALVSRGPEAFYEVLKKENIRDFLSELELKRITETLEIYDPGSEYISRRSSTPGDSEGDPNSQGDEQDMAPSLEYWPQRSDRSIPQLDLGWPESFAYRGVTRATVYMQPPIDGQAHIKEVVRKMIFQAQKVIGVVMDMFTDVDIFKDLLEAGFRRKVAIYIIVDETNVKYFLQMCERAQMHAGHLKHLRVRSTGGTEFFTRSATKFKGALAQKFMFVDGDRAMCGSYSFTWSAARTDRNVITVLSGQVVEAFDKQFQELYLLSRGLSLKSIPVAEEPEPEPVALPTASPVTPASAVVKKLINPKYALVKAKSADQITKLSSAKQAADGQNQAAGSKSKALPGAHTAAEQQSDVMEPAPPIHPGLLNLEKANMFDYLPTWVEPDPEPGSEVLGYINIFDPKIKNVKLSQMNRIKVCDVAQANAQHRQMMKSKELKGNKSHGHESAPTPKEVAPVPMARAPMPGTRLDAKATEKKAGGPFATLAVGQHLRPPETHGMDARPPVPKPRTALVKDSTTKYDALCSNREEGRGQPQPTEAQEGHADHEPRGNCPIAHTKATHHPQSPPAACTQNGLGGDEDEGDEYMTFSDHSCSESSAGLSGRCSFASSTSGEYFEVRDRFGPLRRTNSDVIPNGIVTHLPRKLSDPHISRGTFVSPLGSLPSAKNLSLEDMSAKWKKAVEEIRCVLRRGSSLHPTLDGHGPYASNAMQGPHLFPYRSRNPACTGRGKESIPSTRQEKTPGASKGPEVEKTPAAPGNRLYWQSKRFGSSNNHLSQSHPRGTGKTLPLLPGCQRMEDEVRTPLGIPLSKLSQTKHLKNRAGGGPWAATDPKQKPQGTRSHKNK
ncbi:PREDICTED: protein FAM83G isoform X1 [Gavialis gangeticus]|uniref:protein FAM83G isoform X1 n=1 Tax=Gavialis gangeticus TaxID=94835 RepID=UPI00092F905F|nr:PREDICTED: protein FAM83G isoform X1 [Gavialis gangeticus]